MKSLLFAALFASVPLSLGPIRTPVDLIELNTVIEPNGTPKFQQVILWEKLPAENKYAVRGWYLISDRQPDLRIPYRTKGNLYEVYYTEKLNAMAYSKAYTETVTIHDPEKENQTIMPVQFRLLLPK
jgi:hypothetical protein